MSEEQARFGNIGRPGRTRDRSRHDVSCSPGMIRLSIGTEAIKDIIYDLNQAIQTSQK